MTKPATCPHTQMAQQASYAASPPCDSACPRQTSEDASPSPSRPALQRFRHPTGPLRDELASRAHRSARGAGHASGNVSPYSRRGCAPITQQGRASWPLRAGGFATQHPRFATSAHRNRPQCRRLSRQWPSSAAPRLRCKPAAPRRYTHASRRARNPCSQRRCAPIAHQRRASWPLSAGGVATQLPPIH